MLSDEIKRRFQRALLLSWTEKKWAIAFAGLFFVSILMTFASAIGHHAGPWLGSSLRILAFLLGLGLLMPLAVLISKVYQREVKSEVVNYKEILLSSGETLLGTAYFSVPVVLAFFAIWMVLGLFKLLTAIPTLGPIIKVVLSFVPFLLNLGVVVLCTLALLGLFFVVPAVATEKGKTVDTLKTVWWRFLRDVPTHLMLFAVGVVPLILVLALLGSAAWLTAVMSGPLGHNHVFHLVHRFFVMIPFMALLAPAVAFFFNFALEAQRLGKLAVQKEGSQLRT